MLGVLRVQFAFYGAALLLAISGLSGCGLQRSSALPTAMQEAPSPIPIARRAAVIAQWKIAMPEDIAFSADAVWVPGHRGDGVRIDPQTNAVAAQLKGVGFRAHDAEVVDDGVWISGEYNDLVRFDRATNAATLKVQGVHTYLAFGFGSLWATTRDNSVDRIDPKTGVIEQSITFSSHATIDCNNTPIVAGKFVWVDFCDEATLVQIDPATDRIVAQEPYEKLIGIATKNPQSGRGEAVWRVVTGGLLRIDATTGQGAAFLPMKPEDTGDGWVTVSENGVWVGGRGKITRVNPVTNQVDAVYLTEDGIANVGVGFGSVWVAFEDRSLVQRLDITP